MIPMGFISCSSICMYIAMIAFGIVHRECLAVLFLHLLLLAQLHTMLMYLHNSPIYSQVLHIFYPLSYTLPHLAVMWMSPRKKLSLSLSLSLSFSFFLSLSISLSLSLSLSLFRASAVSAEGLCNVAAVTGSGPSSNSSLERQLCNRRSSRAGLCSPPF